MFWIASFQTSVAFANWFCASVNNLRNLFPNREPINITVDIHNIIIAISWGDNIVTEITQLIIYAKLLKPYDVHILNVLLKSWISLVNRCLSKNATISCRIIDLNTFWRYFIATLSPTKELLSPRKCMNINESKKRLQHLNFVMIQKYKEKTILYHY